MSVVIIKDAHLITGVGEIRGGAIAFDSDTILAVGHSVESLNLPANLEIESIIDADGAPVTPGYIDIHHHGGAGFAYDDGADAARAAMAAHRKHGTTRFVLSLVTASVSDLVARIQALVPVVHSSPAVLGIHAEGPFLHPAHKGAHPEHLLRDPDPAVVGSVVEAAQGTLIQMTLAPERTGGPETTALLRNNGVKVAIGHTSANFAQTQVAIDAGATILTHAFNGMNGIHHREPGPVVAALRDSRVWLEVINDGVHVHPAVVRSLFEEAPDRVILVTDAMSATCNPDGEYILGELDVTVKDGIARLKEGGALAGSTLTMDRAVANAVKSVGVSLSQAVAAATSHPAAALGLKLGRLEAGYPADVLLLDPTSLLPVHVWGPAL